MKVAFPYYTYKGGPDGSPTGWNLNVANLFKLRGHEVCFGEEALDSKADVLFVYNRIDLWESTKEQWDACCQCADKILLGVFNPDTHGETSNIPENCTLVTPFRTMGKPCMVLPYAYYETTPVPGFDRKTIGWTVRNPFVGKEMDGPKPVHLEHLKACYKLVEEGYRLVILSTNSYYEHETMDKALILLKELQDNPLVTAVDHLPYNQYLELLNKTSIVLPLNGIGSTTEALKLGSLPLAWENVVHVYSSVPNGRNYLSLTYTDIHTRLSRLLTDEEYYRADYQAHLDAAGVYDLETALGMLDKVLE